ncbi:phage tail assembly protein T [Pseudomonas delhiensis]|uniref:phage tail assembly protein T n=1 Tax=Pseudomonas delhiensis TaxID=366289 RepID=UPI003CC9136C
MGATVAEAKERVSLPEFYSWMKYRSLRGSLHTGMRLEEGFALLAALYVNRTRTPEGDATPRDFMPHNPPPEPTVEEAMRAWG